MARKIGLDFTGVESFKRASEGEHVCKIVSADMKQSQGGNDMIVVAYEVIRGEDKTARVYENYPLVDTALWKLKGMLQALGMKADGKISLDLDKLIGKILTVVVKHEEYDGKIRARVEEVKKFSTATTDEEDEEDEVEEKPAKKASKKPIMSPPVEEEDDDDWEEDEEEEAPAPKKSKKPEKTKATEKKAPKKPAKVEDEDDDDDWDDDDWDE